MKFNKKNITFSLAIVALIVGIVIFALGYNTFLIRSFGVLFVMLSAQLVRISKGRGQSELQHADQNLTHDVRSGPSRTAKALCFASGIAFAISSIFLYKDAADGYTEVWPVYAFAGCGLIFAVLWGYMGAKSFK